jgi:hypothetical protein
MAIYVFFRTKLTKKRSVQNPEYNFQPESPVEEEETYHVIDDNMVCRDAFEISTLYSIAYFTIIPQLLTTIYIGRPLFL